MNTLPDEESLCRVLVAISAATRTIHLETFRFWKGRAGHAVIRALAEKAGARVQVRLVFDTPDAGIVSEGEWQVLIQSGGQIAHYHSANGQDVDGPARRLSREILVVDGITGLIGGTGTADTCPSAAHPHQNPFNPHYRVWGPAALHLQTDFMTHWRTITSGALAEDDGQRRASA